MGHLEKPQCSLIVSAMLAMSVHFTVIMWLLSLQRPMAEFLTHWVRMHVRALATHLFPLILRRLWTASL